MKVWALSLQKTHSNHGMLGGFLHLFSLYYSSEYSNESAHSVLRKQDKGLSFQECPGKVKIPSLELFSLANIAQIVVGIPWLKDTLFTCVQLVIHWDPEVLFSCSASLCRTFPLSFLSLLRFLPISSACRPTWIYLPPRQPFSLVWFQLHTCEGYILSVTQENDQNADCFWFQNWTLILWKH